MLSCYWNEKYGARGGGRDGILKWKESVVGSIWIGYNNGGPLEGAARPGCCPEVYNVRGIKGAQCISKSAHMELCNVLVIVNKSSCVIIMKSIEREGE